MFGAYFERLLTKERFDIYIVTAIIVSFFHFSSKPHSD